MINLSLTHSDNGIGITPEEAITQYLDVEDGYNVNIQNLVFPNETILTNFVNSLNVKDLKTYDYKSTGLKSFQHTIKYMCSDFKLYVNDSCDTGNMFACLSAKNDDIALKFWNKYVELMKREKTSNYKFTIDTIYINSSGDISNYYIDIDNDDDKFNVSKEYYPYIDTDALFEQFFKSEENILILSGESGLGKSKFATLCIKYLIEHYQEISNNKNIDYFDNNIIIDMVKNAKILSSETFWHDLMVNQSKNPLVIIDDLDFMLTARSNETLSEEDVYKNMFLNNFLTFTDGVLKSSVKFIITTNQKISDIDQALMRKGRLFDILELRKLKNSEALEIWKNANLDEEIFKNKFKNLDSILASDLGSMIQKYQNSSIINNKHNYLKDQKISKVETFKTKKLGL